MLKFLKFIFNCYLINFPFLSYLSQQSQNGIIYYLDNNDISLTSLMFPNCGDVGY